MEISVRDIQAGIICTIASRSQRLSLIVISFCLSGCLSVIPQPTAYHDWSITTKFGRQVCTCPRTRVSLFGSPTPILPVPEGKICKISPIMRILATVNMTHRAIWLVLYNSCAQWYAHICERFLYLHLDFDLGFIFVFLAQFSIWRLVWGTYKLA